MTQNNHLSETIPMSSQNTCLNRHTRHNLHLTYAIVQTSAFKPFPKSPLLSITQISHAMGTQRTHLEETAPLGPKPNAEKHSIAVCWQSLPIRPVITVWYKQMLLFRNVNYTRRRKFLLRSSISVHTFELDLTILESDKRKHSFCISRKPPKAGFINIASLTKLVLRSSYIGHTISTCSSSSMQEAQWKHSLKSKFWYRPVSILMGAVPDLNLAGDPLWFLDIISKQYGWAFFICLYVWSLFPPVPLLVEFLFKSECHFWTKYSYTLSTIREQIEFGSM